MTQKENNIPYDQVFQVIEDRFMAVKMNLGLEVDLKKHFDEIKKNMDEGASVIEIGRASCRERV